MSEPRGRAPAHHRPPPQRASGSSFYTAMRILPRAQREAMFEIYSFCRAVDDIADSAGPRAERGSSSSQQWRDEIDALYAGSGRRAARAASPRPVRDIRPASARTSSPSSTAWRWTCVEDIRAPDLATLDLYCDRVASAVGRLSVRVFGMEEKDGIALAHHLGRALQLTNILRDLDEDAGIGRLYLPREALQQAGIATTDPAHGAGAARASAQACAPVVARARAHFAEADAIMARCPRRTVKAPRIMGEVYRVDPAKA